MDVRLHALLLKDFGRQWVGIDIEKKAVDLVIDRIKQQQGPMFAGVNHETALLKRTDLEPELTKKEMQEFKYILFGRQQHKCNGCRTVFRVVDFEMDHIIPRSKHGTNHKTQLATSMRSL